jgi:molecular chaperone IbpA
MKTKAEQNIAAIRNALGFDLFDQFENQLSRSYPPYNIIRINENESLIELAVAGFSRENLNVKLDKNKLFINGDNVDKELEECSYYAHKGISNKKFEQKFILGEYIKVENVTYDNGILAVKLIKEIPEECKPKIFEIQ